MPLTIEQLWADVKFEPNENQEAAIRHVEGPLYLPAGPGSGKTRVILWRTVNLVVFHGVAPDRIFLSTFTEKAAFQLREGLRALLDLATRYTGQPYDIAQMYVGTVHSLCRRLLTDRRFTPGRGRAPTPQLLDALGQYFHLSKSYRWGALTEAAGLGDDPNPVITGYLSGQASLSKHRAVTDAVGLFNRLSEEVIDPAAAETDDETLSALFRMYEAYREDLGGGGRLPVTDFSLLQQHALGLLEAHPGAADVFEHVVIDEYQDTNAVQERLVFGLGRGHRNVCVVGDDDQALYRFRGATVENFVAFPERCHGHLGCHPRTIPLATNYRSRKGIVDFYTGFMDRCDWGRPGGGHYRVVDKGIHAHSDDAGTAVVTTDAGSPEAVCAEVAALVRRLVDGGKVGDPSQVAFLFPSLKSAQVQRMKAALEGVGLKVYAPRAGSFLDVDESLDALGLLLHVFGRPARGDFPGRDYNEYHDWVERAFLRGQALLDADAGLARFVADRHTEIQTVLADYAALTATLEAHRWAPEDAYDRDAMKAALAATPGVSTGARRALTSAAFDNIVKRREAEGAPAFSLRYILRRAASLDWNVLDVFYRLLGFPPFKGAFDLAQSGEDEGPVANLALISQYLGRFVDEYASVLTAELLRNAGFRRLFFGSYLFALYRLGESEVEDADDPFPRGRVPFLTVHQAKGLEFPVVVLGNPRKDDRGPQRVEELVRPFVARDGEPLDRVSEFDTMRMFYVALSRPEHLLVIPHYKGRGIRINQPFKDAIREGLPTTADLDLDALPDAAFKPSEIPKTYSYTADYLRYQRCPRQYMVFRKFGFVPSRSQTQLFGSLVHHTLEDLHQHLIAQRP